jgi:hypothetical protein
LEKLASITLAMPRAVRGTISSQSELFTSIGKLLMPDNDKSDNSPPLLAFGPVRRIALGMAFGVVFGGSVFLATLIVMLKKGDANLIQLELLNQFFWGYSVSLSGALIGLAWGFGTGFVLGWLLAAVRNTVVWIWLTAVRSRAEMDQYSDFLDHL